MLLHQRGAILGTFILFCSLSLFSINESVNIHSHYTIEQDLFGNPIKVIIESCSVHVPIVDGIYLVHEICKYIENHQYFSKV